MKDAEFYYGEIERELQKIDANLAAEFIAFTKSHSPKEVYLWIDDKKIFQSSNEKINHLMTSFFGDIW